MRATLRLLEKVTLTPEAVKPDDMLPLWKAGVSEEAIEDALLVCAYFNIIDRMADALHVTVPSAEVFAKTAEGLLEHGYA